MIRGFVVALVFLLALAADTTKEIRLAEAIKQIHLDNAKVVDQYEEELKRVRAENAKLQNQHGLDAGGMKELLRARAELVTLHQQHGVDAGLKVQVDELLLQLKDRPATVALPQAVTSSLDASASNQQLIRTELSTGFQQQNKKLSIAVGLTIAGFAILAWLTISRLSKEANVRNALLLNQLNGETMSREIAQQTLKTLIRDARTLVDPQEIP